MADESGYEGRGEEEGAEGQGAESAAAAGCPFQGWGEEVVGYDKVPVDHVRW